MLPVTNVVAYESHHFDQALEVPARAYARSPTSIALFNCGQHPLKQTRELFSIRLSGMAGTRRVALRNNRVVGFAHWKYHPPYAGPLPDHVFNALPKDVVGRLMDFLSVWQNNELAEPHWHFGPVAVHPEYQRQGIARLLLKDFFDNEAVAQSIAFLETDEPGNVDLFSRVGFSFTHTVDIHNVTTWFMIKRPASQESDVGTWQ